MQNKLLIVDDEIQIRQLLNEYLSEFFIVEMAQNGVEAVEKATSWKPDLIIMDMMMPEMDGIEACKMLREQDFTRHIPVLMLTAANTSTERMKAFNFGVDDFISKPFEFEELRIRLMSKLKRSNDLQNVMTAQINIGNLHLDDRKREVTIAGENIDLSPVEYGIVKLLMNCVDQVVSREKIMKSVWKDESKSNRLIDAHMTALRKKFSKFDGDFQTVYGAGYRLKKEKAQA
jgi:DNA-binding response OmpR family regulator